MADDEEPPGSDLITTISKAIDWAYDRAIDQTQFGLAGAEELAREYKATSTDVDEAIESLINWQVFNAGTAGFLTGLGGALTLPVSVPANLVSVLYLQLRLIATIAHLRGHDIRSDRVRGLAVACLVGSSASDVMKDVGINVGTKLTQQAIRRIPGSVFIDINKSVGFRLLTKAGAKGAINVSKLVPIIGGVVSCAFDASTTKAIGAAAKNLFVQVELGTEEKLDP